MIQQIVVEPKYKKENGLWVLDIESVATSFDISVKEKSIVAFPPKQFGGNHKHPRTEIFFALGSGLKLMWLDETSNKQEQVLEELIAYVVPGGLPHAVVNTSDITSYLLEFADGPQRDVEPSIVIE